MLTRRDVLKGAAGIAGAAGLAGSVADALATTAPKPRTPIKFDVPRGGCNCHTHIFDPGHFMYATPRPYTPETANVEDLRALQKGLHLDRVIISQPTVYGSDMACTLDALKQLGPSARGLGFIGDNTSDADLDQWHRGGVRGIVVHGLATLTPLAKRIKGRNWSVEVFIRLTELDKMKDQIVASPVPIVLTQFAGAQAAPGIQQPGFDTLLDLLRSGKVYVHFSAPEHVSKQPPDFSDIAPIAKAMITANPDRIVWGSDWPHAATIQGQVMTGVTPLEQIDDAVSLNLLAMWTSGADQLKRILVDNPKRLYDF